MRVPRLSAISRGAWCAAAAVLLFAQFASAQNAAFKLGSPYNGVPTLFAGTAQPADRIVIYDLPSTGPYAAVAETPDGFIDLIATVNGAPSVQAAAYGVILSVSSGGDGLRFDPETIVGDNPNMTAVKNPTLTQNAAFITLPAGLTFGEENVPGQAAGDQSIGIAAIYAPASPPNQDTTVLNNNGLTSIPIDVDPNLTTTPTRIKEYSIQFLSDDEFTGFVNTAEQILTNSTAFGHVGGIVQIRQSRQGDVNGDGNVNNLDIAPFVASIINLPLYQTANPWLKAAYISDTNADGSTNNLDIPSFVAAIIAGSPEASASPSAVPEPSTWAMVFTALVVSAGAAWRRRRSA